MELLRRLTFASSRSMLLSFVQIHVDAYMFTLDTGANGLVMRRHSKSTRGRKRRKQKKSIPINARPRHPNRDPPTRKPTLLKHLNIPRLQPRRAQQNPSLDLKRAVQRADLLERLVARRREPIHAIHNDDDGQRRGAHAGNDLADLVGVDAQARKRVRLAEPQVRFRRQVRRVRRRGVAAQQGQQVVVVRGAEQRGVDDGLERVEHVLVDGVAGGGLGALRGCSVEFRCRGCVVGFDHGALRGGHAEGFPEPLFVGEDGPCEELGVEHGFERAIPDVALLGEGLRCAEGVEFGGQA